MATDKEIKDALKKLTAYIVRIELAIEKEMKNKESYERGKRIAKIMNALTLKNQLVMHTVLGYSFNKIYKIYGMENEEK